MGILNEMDVAQRRVVLAGVAIVVAALLYALWPMPAASWIGPGGVARNVTCGAALLERGGLGACARLAQARMPFAYGLGLVGLALAAVPVLVTVKRR